MNRFVIALSWLSALVGIAPASALTIGADRLFDGRGNVLAPARLVIEGGKIVSVESSAAPADVRLEGCTLLPGLIDTHVHMAWHFDADGRSHDDEERGESPASSALYALENATATLLGGVTTVQSLGAKLDGELRDAIARGRLPGPRVLTSLEPIADDALSPAELRSAVRERAEQGADVIKLFASKSIRDGGGATFSQEQLDAACGEAKAQVAPIHFHPRGQ